MSDVVVPQAEAARPSNDANRSGNPDERPVERKKSSPVARTLWSLSILLGLLVLWQAVTMVWDNSFFPPPLDIIQNVPAVLVYPMETFSGQPIVSDVLTSLTRMLAGFILGCVAGVVGGTVMGWFPGVRDHIFPVVEFLRSIPATAVLPIFILLLGLGSDMQVTFIAYGVTWYVLINTASGVMTIDPALTEYCRAFKIKRMKLIFGIMLPSASPKIFAGMRIGLTAAMILFVTSEFMGATNGIGYQLIQAQRYFQILDMWSWMIVIAVIGYAANTLLEIIETRVLRWHRESHVE